MPALDRIACVFLTTAGLQVAGLFLDRRLIPWAGTAAIAALLAVAWMSPALPGSGPRWSRWTALGGLALLTVTAGVVDARTDGYGWPAELTEGDAGSQLVEAALVTVAGREPANVEMNVDVARIRVAGEAHGGRTGTAVAWAGVAAAPRAGALPADVPAIWGEDTDWKRAESALLATFLLLGLTMLVTSLFPRPPSPGLDGRELHY
ncbi:hypothetical protein [Actinoplanes sp. NPDC051494]|uniref:hypothetical protein n=1 Tax=Actinoplanes sp. NPDC051494 TaxID=3363907 RepID=UPI0037AB275B